MNGLRKDSGLAVEDRIRLRFADVSGDLLQRALATRESLIRTETLAVEVSVEEGNAVADAAFSSRAFDLGEGRSLRVALSRA